MTSPLEAWLIHATEAWDAGKHPRGPGGRFVSAKAVAHAVDKEMSKIDMPEHHKSRISKAAHSAAQKVDWAQPRHGGKLSKLSDEHLANGITMHGTGSKKGRTLVAEQQRRGGVDWAQPGVDWRQPGGKKAPSVNPRGRSEPHAPAPKSGGVTWAQPGVAWTQPGRKPPAQPRAPHQPAPTPAQLGGTAWTQPTRRTDWAQPHTAGSTSNALGTISSKTGRSPGVSRGRG